MYVFFYLLHFMCNVDALLCSVTSSHCGVRPQFYENYRPICAYEIHNKPLPSAYEAVSIIRRHVKRVQFQ